MKKNSRLKSFFAILLAVSMIFQQSSLTVLATDDTYVEDATATPTPSESEAEAYATEGTEPVAEKSGITCQSLHELVAITSSDTVFINIIKGILK